MGSEDYTRCKHCEVVGIDRPATKTVDFFGDEINLCDQCFQFALKEGLLNEEVYNLKKRRR